MKNYLLSLFLILLCCNLHAQSCLTNSLVINTGYNPITATAITPGADGATPVADPHWIVTSISPDVASAIAITPIGGLIEVTPGSSADVVTTLSGWAVNPSTNPGSWISCLNSCQYWDDGAGTEDYHMVLSRQFRMCSDDSITFTLNIADDNYAASSSIDGMALGFSQPPGTLTSTYSSYAFFTQTVFLTAGLHTLSIEVNDFAVTFATENPTGLDLYGTVASASGSNSLVKENTTECLAYVCAAIAGNCDSLGMPDTVHGCTGTSVAIPAVLSGSDSILSILWTPATGLSSTSILTPSLTLPATSAYYYLTVTSLILNNLVNNGDFSAGTADFTTGYTPGSPAPTSTPSLYDVATNPNAYDGAWPVMGDHTTGTGNMLIVDGYPTSGVSFWCETIAVVPHTNYVFSLWTALLHDPLPSVQVNINGTSAGTFTTSSTSGIWTNYTVTWNSGTATSANICMTDLATGAFGNDFAIDDISFQQECVARDSVYAAITTPTSSHSTIDTAICASAGGLTLNAPAGYSNYLWSTGSTSSSVNITSSGTYWVAATGSCTLHTDTFHVSYKATPVVSLRPDTAICADNTITLGAIEPQGVSYTWSNGSSDSAITVSAAGTYSLTVTLDGCSSSASVRIDIEEKPFISLGNDTTICSGEMITLNTGNKETIWSTGKTALGINITEAGTYWAAISNSCGTSIDTMIVDAGACNVGVPTAFSPNGDGSNDILYVRGDGIKSFDLKIFNRWGQVVFETTSLSKGWDGTFSGQPQTIDIYAYVLNAILIDGSPRTMKGNITLLR